MLSYKNAWFGFEPLVSRRQLDQGKGRLLEIYYRHYSSYLDCAILKAINIVLGELDSNLFYNSVGPVNSYCTLDEWARLI